MSKDVEEIELEDTVDRLREQTFELVKALKDARKTLAYLAPDCRRHEPTRQILSHWDKLIAKAEGKE